MSTIITLDLIGAKKADPGSPIMNTVEFASNGSYSEIMFSLFIVPRIVYMTPSNMLHHGIHCWEKRKLYFRNEKEISLKFDKDVLHFMKLSLLKNRIITHYLKQLEIPFSTKAGQMYKYIFIYDRNFYSTS